MENTNGMQKYILIFMLLGVILISCSTKPIVVPSHNVDEFGCPIPTEWVGLNKQDVQLKIKTYKDIINGEIEFKNEPQIIDFLSEGSKNLQQGEYYICRERGTAEKEGKVLSQNRVDWLRKFFAFIQTKPTSEQLQNWITEKVLRDEFSLYRDRVKVGDAVNPIINETEGLITFDEIRFDKPIRDKNFIWQPFEFRNYIIKIEHIEFLTTIAPPGAKGVKSKIIGRSN